ncbi:unnamed protein product [Malus baccata var. baccata]
MEKDKDNDHRRMQRSLFDKTLSAICNHDLYFVQKDNAFHVLGLLLEQKITAALRMLAYRASADQVDEIARMGKTTILESLMRQLKPSTPMRAQNDLNVLAQSLVFDELLQGKSSRCTYWVNVHKYDGPCYLANGIYPMNNSRTLFGELILFGEVILFGEFM